MGQVLGSSQSRRVPFAVCFAAILLACLFSIRPGIAGAAGSANVQYVFLVQNSGWMEPFFTDDPVRKFDAVVTAFVERAAPPGAIICIASFNKSGEVGGRPSPAVVYQGPAQHDAIATAVARIDLPHRKDGRLANSDYKEALLAAVTRIMGSHSGVIFMITNNKSAPNGRERPEDGPVIERTEAFNSLLRTSDSISRIVAWPIRYPAHGNRFSERGLVIYGIAYGKDASSQLRQASENPAVRAMFKDPPVRLKPLTFDPLTLSLRPGQSGGLSWYLDAAGRLLVDGVSSGGQAIRVVGTLTNTHYPYTIRHARLIAQWQPATPNGTTAAVSVSPNQIEGLQTFSALSGVTIDVSLSNTRRPSLFADRTFVPGMLSIRLVDMQLGISPAFAQKMSGLFGTGAAPVPGVPDELPPQVPNIFVNYKTVNAATTEVPLTFIVSFFPWPLIGVIAAAAAAVLTVVGAVWFLSRERPFLVPIDGEQRSVGLKPLQTKEIKGLSQTYLVSRGLFGGPTAKPKPV